MAISRTNLKHYGTSVQSADSVQDAETHDKVFAPHSIKNYGKIVRHGLYVPEVPPSGCFHRSEEEKAVYGSMTAEQRNLLWRIVAESIENTAGTYKAKIETLETQNEGLIEELDEKEAELFGSQESCNYWADAYHSMKRKASALQTDE
jgi:hypothetical protein